MHGIGHPIGLDVHDVCRSKDGETFRTFQPGMITTVEPGIYVAADSEEVPDIFLGIGVRIEDDVLVTEEGHEVLTDSVPKKKQLYVQLLQYNHFTICNFRHSGNQSQISNLLHRHSPRHPEATQQETSIHYSRQQPTT